MTASATAPPRRTFFAPFQVRSFRFQWPSDLLTSWAQEMETLILAWYVLTATDSVVVLTLFGSLQFLGTLLAPAFGSMADQIGRRVVLCSLRALYASLACVLMITGLTDTLTVEVVFGVAFLMGLVRPSDLVMRNSMIGDTMPPHLLGAAMGLSRTTMDSARIAGALAGAGLFATVGLGYAYVGVVALYTTSLLLTFGTDPVKPERNEGFRLMTEVKAGLVFTWRTPRIKALMWYAFLVNLCAFPITMGVLPYSAREIFGLDETGLGRMIACFGTGALFGSIVIAVTGGPLRRGRTVIVGILIWYGLLLAFGMTSNVWLAYALLFAIGVAQGIAMVTMSIALLEAAGTAMRGRIMGVRMLAVYGLPIGLIASGQLVDRLGYHGMVLLYCGIGVLATLTIALVWRRDLLKDD